MRDMRGCAGCMHLQTESCGTYYAGVVSESCACYPRLRRAVAGKVVFMYKLSQRSHEIFAFIADAAAYADHLRLEYVGYAIAAAVAIPVVYRFKDREIEGLLRNHWASRNGSQRKE